MVDCSEMLLLEGDKYCCLEYKDGDKFSNGQPVLAYIYFFPDMIEYVFNSHTHCVDHPETVHYMYYLMSLTVEDWMHKVLRVVNNIPRTLKHLVKMSFVGHCVGESKLRRFCTPALTVFHQINENGRVLSISEYCQIFMDVCAENRSIFESIWNCGRERQTIYMHDLPFFGIHSHRLHMTSLNYVMAMEAVLFEGHQWHEVYPGTYHCQIEKFNMIFWKGGWPHHDFFTVYLAVELGDMLKYEAGLFQLTQKIYSPNEIEGIIGFAEISFSQWFLLNYMWKRVPNKINSLKNLCRYQVAVSVFVHRMYHFSILPLTPFDIENTCSVESTEEFVAAMSKLKDYLLLCEEATRDNIVTVRGVSSLHGITVKDIDFIWDKGNYLPLEIMWNVMEKYEGFNRWGHVIGFHHLNQWGDIFDPQHPIYGDVEAEILPTEISVS